MIRDAIVKIIEGFDLDEGESSKIFREIMTGEATNAQIGAFLTALRLKGETVEEITGAVKMMNALAYTIDVGASVDIDGGETGFEKEFILDTCGTGGSGTNVFNISTASAFVVAGCGVTVAKHGNRSVSSRCGSADVIEKLGINLNISPDETASCIRKIGIGFLYAPLFHSAMKNALGPRSEIGIRTIFNVLGPLTNPAKANAQILGVYDEKLTQIIAEVLKKLGTKHAFVVYGMDTLDEITTTGKTKISEVKGSKIENYYIKPQDFGIPTASLKDIAGGTSAVNAEIINDILKGKKGPKRDIVVFNSAAALIAVSKAKNFKEGIALAENSIDKGKAFEKLEMLIEYTNM